MTDLIEAEVLIIGSGIAGATAALELADKGVSVTMATRAKKPEESNTYYAQGGIVYRGVDDSPELLAEDIIRAGAGHSNPPAVEMLSRQGPALLERVLLDRVQVEFDRTDEGELSLVREGGHSVARILHVADYSGKAIEGALIQALEMHPNVSILSGHTAVDLLTPSHHSRNRLSVYDRRRCIGAYLFDQEQQRVKRCLARCTILATGGLGQIYLRTSNPAGARGDGLAMAYRAGARVINNEFVQFHPTTFHHESAPNFLISEAVRGSGARLVTADGQPFMQRYAPEWKDLAPRDVVARSIREEMIERDVTHVYLDLRSYVSQEEILGHFPTIYESCQAYGVDITKDLVPIVPAAHYFCGGVWVDEWGRSTIEKLFAVGEVSCTGVHGANRLASTSLLEGVVWGYRVAGFVAENLSAELGSDPDEIPEWRDEGLVTPDPVLINQDMSVIKHIMWNYVGLARTTARLSRAIRELRHLETEIERFYHRTKLCDGLIGLRNAVRSANIVTLAAWANRESMGTHYRE
ncbi:MAG: L-aspartate oxidase [Chloroflexota bacterium]|nr:L-aspartate oxidase [Chloroflexota bacterium]